LGDVQLLMFRGGEVTRPNGEIVQTWRLFIQERDPERRPRSSVTVPAPTTERGYRELEPLVTTPIPPGGDPIDDL
jgi:hypothetical protein